MPSLEIDTLTRTNMALEAMTPSERYRVLQYLNSRFELDHQRGIAGLKIDSVMVVKGPAPSQPAEERVTVKEAARILGMRVESVYGRIKMKGLQTKKIDGVMTLAKSDLTK